MNFKKIILGVSIGLTFSASVIAQPPPTTFTYQGYLEKSDEAASGLYTITAKLFDAPVGGTQIGLPLTYQDVQVDDGRFSLPLNFGDDVFNGSSRWLEISILSDGGAVPDTLSPRQQISPAPMAIYSLQAGKATTATVAETAMQTQSAANGVPQGYSILGASSTPPHGFVWSGTIVEPKQIAGTWEPGTDMPGAIFNPVGGVINGNLYVVSTAATYEYNPTTKTWASKAPMPNAYVDGAGAVVNGKLYYYGGQTGTGLSDVMMVYDPQTDLWTIGAPGPKGTSRSSAVAIGSSIYFLGGDTTSESGVTDVLIYNTSTNTWRTGSPMPTGRRHATAVPVNSTIHVFGGDGDTPNSQYAHEVYDTHANAWMSASNLPDYIASGSGALLDGKIHLFGGYSGQENRRLHRIYDPALASWSKGESLPDERMMGLAAIVDGDLVLAGGVVSIDYGPDDSTKSVIVYKPKSPSQLYVHVKE